MNTPWIMTHTRRRVNPLALRLEDIHIRDIAHALAQTNRFNGHADMPLNVAQHSVYVSRLCPTARLHGLLHDASEAYLGDVTKWLKATGAFDAYREAEAAAQAVIYQRFGLSVDASPEVAEADKLMCRFEAFQGFHVDNFFDRPDYPHLTPEEYQQIGPWTPLSWDTSRGLFLAAFHDLFAIDDLS